MPTQVPYVTIHPLWSGTLTLPSYLFIAPCPDKSLRQTVPSLSFLIQHYPSTPTSTSAPTHRILFDLGIRHPLTSYSPEIQAHCSTREPLSTQPNVVASLAKGGLSPRDIDLVILSHVHWDHIGQPADFPSSTRFVVGHGALDLLRGAGKVGNNSGAGSHCHFEPNLLPPDRTIELPDPRESCSDSSVTSSARDGCATAAAGGGVMRGTEEANLNTLISLSWRSATPNLPATIDLFNDGSLYIVDAPGHLPGHVNLLARTTSTPKSTNNHNDEKNNDDKDTSSISLHLSEPETGYRHVYLAADACHDTRIFTGEKGIATWMEKSRRRLDSDRGGEEQEEEQKAVERCIHSDKATAEQTLERIRMIRTEGVSDEEGASSRPGGVKRVGAGVGDEDVRRGGIEVVFAHDWRWAQEAREKGAFWPGRL